MVPCSSRFNAMSVPGMIGSKELPVKARHVELSLILSADDDISRPSQSLLALSIEAISKAREITLEDISSRVLAGPRYPDVWPGEHYKLLAALVVCLGTKSVVEIGTGGGLSSLCMKKYLPADGSLVTFDLVPWRAVSGTALSEDDFKDGRLLQLTDDLSTPLGLAKNYDLLRNAGLVLIDAAKDGELETLLINNLKNVMFTKCPIVVFDDIRLWNMLKIWREISAPKLDLTSFGHWSGTGLVEWIWN